MNWRNKFIRRYGDCFVHPGPNQGKGMYESITRQVHERIEAARSEWIRRCQTMPQAQRPQISRLVNLLQARQKQLAETVERERERAEEGLF